MCKRSEKKRLKFKKERDRNRRKIWSYPEFKLLISHESVYSQTSSIPFFLPEEGQDFHKKTPQLLPKQRKSFKFINNTSIIITPYHRAR